MAGAYLHEVADGRARGRQLCIYVGGCIYVCVCGLRSIVIHMTSYVYMYMHQYAPLRLPCFSAWANAPPQRCYRRGKKLWLVGTRQVIFRQRNPHTDTHKTRREVASHPRLLKASYPTHSLTKRACSIVLCPHDRSSSWRRAGVSLIPRDLARA